MNFFILRFTHLPRFSERIDLATSSIHQLPQDGLKKDKTCIELLELKGKCYIDMNRYREALAAADEILIVLREKDNATALGVKASALYNMGDFEHALMSFHRYVGS